MTKVKEQREKTLKNITYAEARAYEPHHKKEEAGDSLEDVFMAVGMAEGGIEDYARRLHPLFHKRHGNN